MLSISVPTLLTQKQFGTQPLKDSNYHAPYFGTGRISKTKAGTSTIRGGGKDPRKPGSQQPKRGHYQLKANEITKNGRLKIKERLAALKDRIPNWENLINNKIQNNEGGDMKHRRTIKELYPHLTLSRKASFDEKYPPLKSGRPLKSQTSGSSVQGTALSASAECSAAIEHWQSELPQRQETPAGVDSIIYPGYARTAEGGYRPITPSLQNSARFPGQVRLPNGFYRQVTPVNADSTRWPGQVNTGNGYRPTTPVNVDSTRWPGQVNTGNGYRPTTPIGYSSQRYPGFWLKSSDPNTGMKNYNPL